MVQAKGKVPGSSWLGMSREQRLMEFMARNAKKEDGTESEWETGYQECLADILFYVVDGHRLPPDMPQPEALTRAEVQMRKQIRKGFPAR